MSATVTRLYAVREAVDDPFTIPEPPAPEFRFVELDGRDFTFAVYTGNPPDHRLGCVRHDPDNGLWIAMTAGSPDGKAAADIRRNLRSREAAAGWLSATFLAQQQGRRFR